MQYNDLMPIQPGCLALVLDTEDPENDGQVVEVKYHIGDSYKFGPYWLVNKRLRFVPHNLTLREALRLGECTYRPYAYERNLIRIDGFPEGETLEQYDELLVELDIFKVLEKGYF